jgi:2-polyprenyl-3-methyl-5-hydroxy-6-metoxy-1,4-benzoquinol methylase
MQSSSDNGNRSEHDKLTGPECMICGCGTAYRFSKTSRADTVAYFRCACCGHLTASNADNDAHYDLDTYFTEIDTGWKDRNRTILEFVMLMTRLPGIALPFNSLVVDYGCGAGMLVADLNAAGFKAYGYEPFRATRDATGRILNDWREAKTLGAQAKLVTCIEVLEHVRHPDELLQKVSEILHSDGYLLISTEIYNTRTHGSDWYYLNPAAGHVSIYTEKSLLSLMSRHGLAPILRISGVVWLFRFVGTRQRTWLESGYFLASQSRLKLGIRLRL